MIKIHLMLSLILFTIILSGFFSFNQIFAELETDKSVYSKGDIIKISGSINQLNDNRINIIEIEITDSDNNTVVNEYTPLVDDEFFISYDTITWETGNYKITILYNDVKEFDEFEISNFSTSDDDYASNINSDKTEQDDEDSVIMENSSSQPSSTNTPNPPLDLKADVISPTQIDLSWSLPYDDNPSITGFKIESRINTDPSYSVIVANTNNLDTTYSHTDLIPSTVYAYRVSSINSSGESEPSTSVIVKTPDAADIVDASRDDIRNSDVPTNVAAKVISPTSIELSWNAPSQTYGQVINGYTIKQEIASGVYNEITSTVGSNTDHTLSNFETDKTYTFVVVANYMSGSSNISESVTVTLSSSNLNNDDNDKNKHESDTTEQNSSSISPDSVPDKPVELRVKPVSSTQLDLSWSSPKNNSINNNSITGYKIEVRTIHDTSHFIVVDNTENTDTLYSHNGLIPNTTYIYRVSAINENGTSEPSNENLANTLISDPEETNDENNRINAQDNADDDNANDETNISASSSNALPDPPVNLKAIQISQNRINLSWSPPIETGTSMLVGYKIESKTSNESDYSVLVTNTGNASITTYSHTDLVSGLTYYYQVSAISSAGESNPSETAEAKIVLSGNSDGPDFADEQIPSLQPLKVTVNTDKSVYHPNDTIEISGTTNNSSQTLPLGIRVVSSENQIVYARSIAISDNQTFDALITASQRESSSWQEGNGNFTVEITYNGRIQATSTFENLSANVPNGGGPLNPSYSDIEPNKQTNQSSSSQSDSIIVPNNELEILRNQNIALHSANQQLEKENNEFKTEIKELNERIEQLDIIVKEQIRVMMETLGIS